MVTATPAISCMLGLFYVAARLHLFSARCQQLKHKPARTRGEIKPTFSSLSALCRHVPPTVPCLAPSDARSVLLITGPGNLKPRAEHYLSTPSWLQYTCVCVLLHCTSAVGSWEVWCCHKFLTDESRMEKNCIYHHSRCVKVRAEEDVVSRMFTVTTPCPAR